MSNVVVAQQNVIWQTGDPRIATAGLQIQPWQVIWFNPVTNKMELARADSATKMNAAGIALAFAYPNQPIVYAADGEILLLEDVLTVGEHYVLSASVDGAITTLPDVGPTHYLTYLFRALAVNRLVMSLNATGIILP